MSLLTVNNDESTLSGENNVMNSFSAKLCYKNVSNQLRGESNLNRIIHDRDDFEITSDIVFNDSTYLDMINCNLV